MPWAVRLSSRWPIVLAAVFCSYAVVLLWNAFHAQEQLKGVADSRLIASNQRKATAVGDFIAERRNGVAALAERHEVETYLINKALGMSPRYGLNASLDVIEQAFRRQSAQKSTNGEPIYGRIAFFAENGDSLVDIAPGAPPIPLPKGSRESTTLSIDLAHRQMIASAPVAYKGSFSGTIVAVAELDQLSRYLVSSGTQDQYHELLLTEDGRELPGVGREAVLNSDYTRNLGTLPANRLVFVDAPSDGDARHAKRPDVAVRSPVPGTRLSLVTLQGEEQLYGQITSRVFLLAAAAFPVVVLLAAILYDRMRHRALKLQAAVVESDRRRGELQGRNIELSAEIGRRQAVEKELREKSAELEAMADDLRSSMRRAEEANLAKSRFLATVGHEIRTPMNGVLGMAQRLLVPDSSEEERLRYARTILTSGQTLLTLMNDILDLSKADAGQLRLTYSHLNAKQIIDETAALFAEPARQKGLQMEVAWNGPSECTYVGDPIRLRQMLSNLASNSIKFTDSGFIRIEGTEIERSSNDALLEFKVSDSGIGIPTDNQSMLFQPFTQVDASSTRRFGGTGLGLSIVRSLAKLMHGEVGVESAGENGAQFWIRIRAALVGEMIGADGSDAPIIVSSVPLVAAHAEAMVAEGSAPKSVAPVDVERIVPLVREIDELLQAHMYRARGCFQTLQELAADSDVSRDFEAIGKLITGYKYDEALAKLRKLASARNWTQG